MISREGRVRWLPFAAAVALVGTAIVCADGGMAAWLFKFVERHPGSDKLGHFIGVGGMAWTLNFALRGRLVSLGMVKVQLGGMLVALVMTAEECSQMLIARRNFDLTDLAANYAGILVAGWLSRRR